MENNNIYLIQYIRHIVNNCNKTKRNIVELVGYKQDAIAKITDTLGSLDELINHLNDKICVFRKDIESKNVELENFSLQTFVKDTVARLKAIVEDDRIDLKSNFQANIKDSIIGDSLRIRAVLSQLVEVPLYMVLKVQRLIFVFICYLLKMEKQIQKIKYYNL
ncbi:histidine kinase [Orientia tsutsugamushi]|uniref:Histidine kinase n=1 Tax=Orientia tsutsugamushi TaxID=784 RepID=A0A2R8EZC2_ORITS|nr:hypothetical protein [Orientia tsutsugamushi]SPM44431.1 histidine kinase [Orientia tsutsugamushi]